MGGTRACVEQSLGRAQCCPGTHSSPVSRVASPLVSLPPVPEDRGLTRSNRLHELTFSFQAGHSCSRRGFVVCFFSVCRVAPRRVLGTWRGSEDPRWPAQGPVTLGI